MIEPVKNTNPRVAELAEEVREWSRGDRLALVREVLDTLEETGTWIRPRTKPVECLFGVLATGDPPSDDEECARILEEEKMRRYGS